MLLTAISSSKQQHFSAELLPHKAEALLLLSEKQSALLASCCFSEAEGLRMGEAHVPSDCSASNCNLFQQATALQCRTIASQHQSV